MNFSHHHLCCFTIASLFVLDKSTARNKCLQHSYFKNLCKIAQASNVRFQCQTLPDLLTYSWLHSMLFALPGYQFPYTVMNRCFYLMWSWSGHIPYVRVSYGPQFSRHDCFVAKVCRGHRFAPDTETDHSGYACDLLQKIALCRWCDFNYFLWKPSINVAVYCRRAFKAHEEVPQMMMYSGSCGGQYWQMLVGGKEKGKES